MEACTEMEKPQHRQVPTTQGFEVDDELSELLEHLWGAGAETICSCQGDRNVKHGLFGKRHDHDGFIAFTNAEHATHAYKHLVRHGGTEVLLETVISHHETEIEHWVRFTPTDLERVTHSMRNG